MERLCQCRRTIDQAYRGSDGSLGVWITATPERLVDPACYCPEQRRCAQSRSEESHWLLERARDCRSAEVVSRSFRQAQSHRIRSYPRWLPGRQGGDLSGPEYVSRSTRQTLPGLQVCCCPDVSGQALRCDGRRMECRNRD